GADAEIKPIDRLVLSLSYNYIRSDGVDSGERLFSQSVLWSRISLQLTRELSMRFVSQYNDRYKTWDMDPLVTYRINSLTLFYFGSTHNYSELDLNEDGHDAWELSQRQFFLKLQYLFQI
ncbi:MAG: hypothetical protein PHD74_10135, partial [Candidatus Krumholzibacteria bacterium]|nr:hypothetical protein [Candidatus Krumholzibacteria bacterium]